MSIGKRIKAVRIAAGFSQADLERKSGIKREYLSKLENCSLKNPTYNTLCKIANALRVSVALLVDPGYEPVATKLATHGNQINKFGHKVNDTINKIDTHIRQLKNIQNDYCELLKSMEQGE